MISIVFPHLDNPENNRLLDLNLKMIKENTTCEYEIMCLWGTQRPDMVYMFLDWGFRNAKYNLVLWHSSDILLAPGWNENIIKSKDEGDWIGLELIECGAIGVSPTNIKMDFGMTAKKFNRKAFEEYTESKKDRKSYREGFSWYSPSVFKKQWYKDMGGFQHVAPFPYCNDSRFLDKVKSKDARFIVANSYAYHFQRQGVHLGRQPERK